jgi:hypothetical protein
VLSACWYIAVLSQVRRPSNVDIDDGKVQVMKSLCQEGFLDVFLCIDVESFTRRIYNFSIDINPNVFQLHLIDGI